MVKFHFRCLLFCLVISFGCTRQPIVIYVDKEAIPKTDRLEESTFSTIEDALGESSLLMAESPGTPVEIHIRKGTYHLNKPLVIDENLSGLSLIGSATSEVKIKGSTLLKTRWTPHENGIYVTTVSSQTPFDQLIVNGEKQILARYPNYNEDGGHWQGHAPDAFSPERVSTWKDPKGAIIHVMHGYEWGDFHYVITGIDSLGNPVLEGGHQNNRPAPMHKTYRMVENVYEELDSPGEWYFDANQSKLYYWPPSDVDLEMAEIEGVILNNLITIQGKNKPTTKITLRNITFQHAKRTVLEEYEPLLRSDWTIYRGGAVFLKNTEGVRIEDCEFSDLGGNAIFISGYNRKTTVRGNHIVNTGASGVSFVGNPNAVRSPSFQYSEYVDLEEMDTVRGPKTDEFPKNCIVDNNLIHRTGRLEKQTAGVQIAMAMNITVSRNSIYDVPRAGINIGDGTWGGHLIEYNDVFNTVLESGDHGSFNSWGRDRFWHPNRQKMDSLTTANPQMPLWDAIETTVIRNNRFRCDHGWDIDLDDGSSNYEIYNNLCLNGGIKLREGFYRKVTNNIMVNNGFHPHVWFRESGDIFTHNIVSTSHQDIRLQGWGKEIDHNLFLKKDDLLKAQEHQVDANSGFGNPGFINPYEGNFKVEEDSPALLLSFVNFPMDTFGVQKAGLKKIRKTPDIPKIILGADPLESDSIQIWLGFSLKNINTMAERSASGLSKEAGVIILDIAQNSVASRSELQKGDVILQAENSAVNSMDDLFRIYQEHNWKGKINLEIFRNQKSKKLVLLTK